MPEPARPDGFAYTHAVQVSLRDLDGFGHVNHAVYLSYLEVARTRYYFDRLGLTTIAQLQFVLGSVACRYVAPAFLHESLIVSLAPTKIGRKSWDLRYEIREEESGRLIVRAESTQVQFDHDAGRTIEIPPALREILERDRGAALSGG